MKKIIAVAILIFIATAIPAAAFWGDDSLVKIWNNRKDLQKAFPGDPSTNTKLADWAKKYGWKENPDLFNYYPDKLIVEKISSAQYESRIKSLEDRLAKLEQAKPVGSAQPIIQQITQPATNTITERVEIKQLGHVIQCCGSKTSAWLRCNQEVQGIDCSKGERAPGDSYAVYLYAQ